MDIIYLMLLASLFKCDLTDTLSTVSNNPTSEASWNKTVHGPGPALLNFSDQADTDEILPYSVSLKGTA